MSHLIEGALIRFNASSI